MSRATSETTGKRYGLERVCRVLQSPRSTLYAQGKRESTTVEALHPQRPGPKPKVSDAELLVAIREDLAASPFTGEGQRRSGRGCASCGACACLAPGCCA